MVPKVVCRKCNAEVNASDVYCSSCGEKLDWGDAARPPKSAPRPAASSPKSSPCPTCGQMNQADAATCAGCGARLRKDDENARTGAARKPGRESSGSRPLSFLQSWKLTAILGALLVATLIYIKMNHQQPSPSTEGMPPEHEAMVKEIQSLEKSIESNPKDGDALLRLANLYYDQRLFPRAITMYERYLEGRESDANARVDLGVSYFEMALQDSSRRDQFFASAKAQIEKALQFEPKHQLAYFNLGMINLHTGDADQADMCFRKCYQIDSLSETGRKAQQLIQKHITTHPSS